jgi:hypothetical protein
MFEYIPIFVFTKFEKAPHMMLSFVSRLLDTPDFKTFTS